MQQVRRSHGAARQAGLAETPSISSPSTAFGIDVGGGTTRVGLIDPAKAAIVSVRSASTPSGGEPTALATLLKTLIHEIVHEAGAAPKRVGLAIPGMRDTTGDVMLRAVNLPALANVNLRELLRSIGCPGVIIESDAVAAGWAQWRVVRHAERIERIAYLSLGTGVGGCVILGGEIVRHTRGGPGHLGHLIVDSSAGAPLCPCGGRGCFEAVLQQARAAGGGEFDEAGLERVAAGLATLVADIAHLYAPDRVLIGGGVVDHFPPLVDRVRGAFARIRSRIAPAGLEIAPAPLRTDDAGVIGAALLAAERR